MIRTKFARAIKLFRTTLSQNKRKSFREKILSFTAQSLVVEPEKLPFSISSAFLTPCHRCQNIFKRISNSRHLITQHERFISTPAFISHVLFFTLSLIFLNGFSRKGGLCVGERSSRGGIYMEKHIQAMQEAEWLKDVSVNCMVVPA